MKLLDALHKAQTESALHECVKHVLFKVTKPLDDNTAEGYYIVSDWHDSDCIIKSFSNGNERY